MIHRLDNPVRSSAWGSRTHIARLTNRELGDVPAAEMWVGAHPSSPSRLSPPDGRRLDQVIAEAPDRCLGQEVRRRMGDDLPYIMKLIAVSAPLSLQVHPGADGAKRGFEQQEIDGIALDARERSYRDPSHKPELLYALTGFEGMAGFREPVSTAQLLRCLALPWLDEVADVLESAADAAKTLRDVVTTWLSLPADAARPLLAELRRVSMTAAERADGASGVHRPPGTDASEAALEWLRVFPATVGLVDLYPDDPAVLVTLLLNHVVLAPGESMFIDAGVIHAYTSGFGIEVMASSDNVIRAGLTPKHVNTAEWLDVARFTPQPPPRWVGTRDGSAVVLAPPVDEFELHVLEPEGRPVTMTHEAPRVVLCLQDKVELQADGERLTLERGEAAFVEASSGALIVSGHGRAAVAQTPARLR